jgi:tRNA-dihydrouridine synthase A
MMGYTDRHFRHLLRLLAPRAVLYTEMLSTGALLSGDASRHLAFDGTHPVALQLGGSEPAALAAAARLAAAAGYDEVNLNAGCPSPRVARHCFGARLMLEPALTGACLRAMVDATPLPVTVKCRLGVDAHDSDTLLDAFVGHAAAAGVRTVIVHARRALLDGLSPHENRVIPPLQHARVWSLKRRHPALHIVVNGGIRGTGDIDVHLAHVDGVMLGRAATADPMGIARAAVHLDGGTPPALPDVLAAYAAYATAEVAAGTPLHAVARHVLNIAHGLPGARRFRRLLTESLARRPRDAACILGAADDAGLLRGERDMAPAA